MSFLCQEDGTSPLQDTENQRITQAGRDFWRWHGQVSAQNKAVHNLSGQHLPVFHHCHGAEKNPNIWPEFFLLWFVVPFPNPAKSPQPHYETEMGQPKEVKAAEGILPWGISSLGKPAMPHLRLIWRLGIHMPSPTSFPGSCLPFFFFFNSLTAPPSLTYWEQIICNLPDTKKNEAILTTGSHYVMIIIFTLDSFIDPSVRFVKGTLITWNLHHISQHEHAGQDKDLRMLYFFRVAMYFHSWKLLCNTWWGKKLSCRNVQCQ